MKDGIDILNEKIEAQQAEIDQLKADVFNANSEMERAHLENDALRQRVAELQDKLKDEQKLSDYLYKEGKQRGEWMNAMWKTLLEWSEFVPESDKDLMVFSELFDTGGKVK